MGNSVLLLLIYHPLTAALENLWSERMVQSGTPTPCVSLDDFVRDHPVPDAIKCDVEGAEIEVLRGAEQLLRTRHPWIICELHSETKDRDSRELLRLLGYALKSVDVNHVFALPSTYAQTLTALQECMGPDCT